MSDSGIELIRDCDVVEVPGGRTLKLEKGTIVSITQALGGSFTLLVPSMGGLFRLSGRDADAIGKEAAPEPAAGKAGGEAGSPSELRDEIWSQLRTCFDPEIPVNIVDLGLIYDLQVSPSGKDGARVDVKMTLTAQGCGMGASIAADAQNKIEGVPGVASAGVEVVWDPPWTPERISEEGKSRLGIG